MSCPRPAASGAGEAGLILANSITVTVIGLAAFALTARLVPCRDMRTLIVLTLVVAVVELLAGFGLGSTATRYVILLDATDEHEEIRRADYDCLRTVVLFTMMLVCGVYF
jgi:O-antigen/teichoic acid export membrane protein